ncbi:MAG: polysaccharide deacetylase family protein [Candidatus Zipacnadales bacterium]
MTNLSPLANSTRIEGRGGVVHKESQALAEARRAREQRAKARQRRRLRTKRLQRATTLLVLLGGAWLALQGLQWQPVRVSVDGQKIWVWGNSSVALAIRKAHITLPQGSLIDVRGNVLQEGGGSCALPFSEGRLISYQAPARWYRELTFQPGADIREPVKATATLLAASSREKEWQNPWKPEYLAENLSIVSLQRREQGALSGLAYLSEQAIGLPLERPTSGIVQQPKRMALTFDDGPSNVHTREIMSILEAHGARGTFFLLADCVAGHEDIVREAVAHGHEIGNHSWGHQQMTRLGVAGALANIEKAERIISAVTGQRCRWVRPPYGATNAAIRKALLNAGYNIALWSCDTNDWQRPGTSTIYRRILAGAKAGANVLLHDGGGHREQTVEAVRQAVPELVRMGYELVTLSEMVASRGGEEAGMRLLTQEGMWEAQWPTEPITIYAAGKELKSLGPLLAINGKVLVPAPPILDALDAHWEWDRAGETITISSARGRFRFRLHSRLVSWNDREVQLDIPPLLYHDVPLISAQALARAADARLDERLGPRSFNFVPLGPARPFSSAP